MRKLWLLSLCVIGYSAQAQIPQPDPDTTAKHFLIVASISNLQEVSAAKQALAHAKQTDVKNFAQMMVKDHSDAEQKLLAVARSRNIQLSQEATAGIQPDPLLTDANFDKLYVHKMVSGHKSTVETFENYAVNGKDPAVKGFAQQILPTLKMHLQMIKDIEKKL